ncbi:MAG: 2-dehydropantoate 2-reductase [Clostridia bacterium]|nr:2-dehydropantoate 2-reductase [Clostridia bacterium]
MPNLKRPKIAVYGAGAMGTVLGALLTKTGADVTLITRNQAHVDGLNNDGAKIICTAAGTQMTIPVSAITPSQMTEKYHLIFLMTKQRENEKTAQFLLDYLEEDGILCTTQNGLPEQLLSEIIGTEKTYGAVMSWGATFVGEGAVELTSMPASMTVEVGGYENDNAKTEWIANILKPIGELIQNENFVKTTDNLAGVRWSKLALNASFSGLSCVTGLKFGEIAKRFKTRKVALKILQESFSVANALGVRLAPMQGHDMQKLLGGTGFFNYVKGMILLPIAMKNHRELVSGMLKDLEKGRKCEIDFIDGVVADLAKQAGVQTPCAERVVEIVHGIENGLYELSYDNINFF